MKKISAGILIILFFYFFGTNTYGETKIGNSDFLSQDNQQNLKNNPVSIPTTPKTILTSTQTKPSGPNPVMTQQLPSIPPLLTTKTNLPTLLPSIGKTAIPKSPMDLKPLDIKVPNYDQQLQQLIQSEQPPKVKKKKPLLDAILEEITNYGVFIILGLVAFILVYVVRREKVGEKAKPADEADEPGETSESSEGEVPKIKRDIWDEKF